MFFGFSRLRKPGGWWLWLSGRAVALAVVSGVVAYILQELTLPRLAEEGFSLDPSASGLPDWIENIQGFLLYTPVPGLCLGVAAFIFRPFRRSLSILAILASLAALVLVVGTLVAALAPMYSSAEQLLR